MIKQTIVRIVRIELKKLPGITFKKIDPQAIVKQFSFLNKYSHLPRVGCSGGGFRNGEEKPFGEGKNH